MESLPVETDTGVSLATRRDITVADYVLPGNRISIDQLPTYLRQPLVLNIIELTAVSPFKFYPQREVIAILTAFKRGLPRVPGSLVEGYKLQNFTGTSNQQMTGNMQTFQTLKVSVTGVIDLITEEPSDKIATKVSSGETNAMDNDQIQIRIRAVITIR